MGINISYGITVCNERNEIEQLINHIKPYIRQEDEIVVLFDTDNGTQEVRDYLEKISVEFALENIDFHRIFYSLNKDFASFKNFLKQHTTKNYLFQLDSDEIPSKNILQHLPLILENNPVDLFVLPRVNTVDRLTQEDIQKWGWRVNDENYINFPDSQQRIIRNIPEIQWVNKVHEQVVGWKTISEFPMSEEWALFHHKSIDRQRKQNEFYSHIN